MTYIYNEIVHSTMKSKTSLDEIKAYGFDEIKSVFLSAEGDFICEADFIHAVDLFRCKTDLVEKSVLKIQYAFFWKNRMV